MPTKSQAPDVAVHLPEALLRLFPGAGSPVELRARHVCEAIAQLDERYPGMRDRLCDSRPALRRHLRVFVDGERATLETKLASGAEMLVMTAISGG